jgi:hypothetical protein
MYRTHLTCCPFDFKQSSACSTLIHNPIPNIMNIRCTDKKTFELTDESGTLGHIAYNGIFSFKARAFVGTEAYTITPKGIFSTTIVVTQQDQEVASVEMSLKGHMHIAFRNGQAFTLKASGMLQNKYVLENEERQTLLRLTPDFNWAQFNYNYSLSYDDKPDILLVLLATYAANYHMAAMSSAVY